MGKILHSRACLRHDIDSLERIDSLFFLCIYIPRRFTLTFFLIRAAECNTVLAYSCVMTSRSMISCMTYQLIEHIIRAINIYIFA